MHRFIPSLRPLSSLQRHSLVTQQQRDVIEFGPTWSVEASPSQAVALLTNNHEFCPEPMLGFIDYMYGATRNHYKNVLADKSDVGLLYPNKSSIIDSTEYRAGYDPQRLAIKIALALTQPDLFQFAYLHAMFLDVRLQSSGYRGQERAVKIMASSSELVARLEMEPLVTSMKIPYEGFISEGPLQNLAYKLHQALETQFGKIQINPFSEDIRRLAIDINTKIFADAKYVGIVGPIICLMDGPGKFKNIMADVFSAIGIKNQFRR